jgi:predicted permease
MPAFLRTLIARVKGLIRRDAVGEIHDELAFHFEMRVEEYERRGMSKDEARKRARERVGSIAVHQDRGYDVRGGGAIETVWQDIRYALRLWRRQPGFAIAAIATLALGIGISTALFSVIDAALLRPLPYPHPEQLVQVTIEERAPNGEVNSAGPSLNDARHWRTGSRTISAVGIIRAYPTPTIIDAGGGPERVAVSEIGEGALEVYQLAPALGRAVSADDLAAGAPRVVMLGHGYWQSHFAGSRDVLGRVVRFTSGAPATIVGVLPQGFYAQTDLWKPHASFRPGDIADQRGLGTSAYARLRAGVTMEAAAADLSAVSKRTAAERGQPTDVRVLLQSLRADTIIGYGPTIGILSGAVAFVLLIACVNVAGLLIARGSARRPEMAIRTSIGASRGRLIRQLVTESIVLALCAGLIGILLAGAALDTLVAAIPLDLPLTSSVSLNPTVLVFALALSLVTALAFGLVPALSLSRTGVSIGGDSLRVRRSPLSRRGGQWLIGVEVAVAVVLLVVAGLLLRSLNRAMKVDVGFDASAVMVMKVEPLIQNANTLTQFYPALLERLRSHPNVSAAGAVDALPLDPLGFYGFASSPGQETQDVRVRTALPGYFEAMGLDVVEGQLPSAGDISGNRSVVLNKAAAARLFPRSSAIGKSIILASARIVAKCGCDEQPQAGWSAQCRRS